jgi:hypothetical protein
MITLYCVASVTLAVASPGGEILIQKNHSPMEHYAAMELQRYLFQVSRTYLEIRERQTIDGPAFLVGVPHAGSTMSRLLHAAGVLVTPTDPGPQGYVLKKTMVNGTPVILIAGSDTTGCLYGVYGLLADYYHIGFFMNGDVLPQGTVPLRWADVDEKKHPAVPIRGILPWTNFPQSATSYSWSDWQYIIDHMAKMRLNLLHIHNYNGEQGHNEMYHNFTLRGFTSRVWMPTARTGHKWSGPGWEVSKYLFGAADLFDDYDFGAECALHNDHLTNEEVFRKSVVMFQRVLAYAHSRGVRIALGLDIDLIPKEYNASADDPEVIAARVHQLASDFPALDYVLCFQSENVGKNPEFYAVWSRIFSGFYAGVKVRMPRTRIGVSGWGLDPQSVSSLPEDVICAPIASYADTCESGSNYGRREYWGCPWLERDFNSSEYYYPYGMDLSNTIVAYGHRASNMKGFYALTWRLTDAIDPKLYYLSRAPWYEGSRYGSSRGLYLEYATMNYGPRAAGEITDILDQNEPFASASGECQETPPFSRDHGKFLFTINSFAVLGPNDRVLESVSAAGFSSQKGVMKKTGKDGGVFVDYINDCDWAAYRGLDFGAQASACNMMVSSGTSGGLIRIRLDSLNGAEVGICSVGPTGGWERWTTVRVPLQETHGRHNVFLLFELAGEGTTDLAKTNKQLATLDCIIQKTASEGRKSRLEQLRCRIAAVRDHILLNSEFGAYRWEDLPGRVESWVHNFTNRVTDISSLGNVVSIENRYLQQNYVDLQTALLKTQPVRSPSRIVARGTKTGAVVSWENVDSSCSGYFVYRNGTRITSMKVPGSIRTCSDTTNGACLYSVTAITDDGRESARGIPSSCLAGAADTIPPTIIVISPVGSAYPGSRISVIARVLDTRTYASISARLHYRSSGEKKWKAVTMQRRSRAIFAISLPPQEVTVRGLEYFIEASDGTNSARYPASAPAQPLSVVVEECDKNVIPKEVSIVRKIGHDISWMSGEEDVMCYRIYRDTSPDFEVGPECYVTYVAGCTAHYTDTDEDFTGAKLHGTWFYRVTAMDRMGFEGPASRAVQVHY